MKLTCTLLITLSLILIPVFSNAGWLNITLENDVVFDDDSDYTHGTRIEYIQDNGLRYGVSQQMYTPLGLGNKDQIEGNHPYAGTLVGFIGGRCLHPKTDRFTVYTDLELQLGVLGPSSYAEQTQKFVHKLLDCRDPQGWDHQLHDEIIVQSAYWQGCDIRLAGQDYGWNIRWKSELGGLLGTLQIAPGVNTDLKFGYGFGASEIDHEMYVRHSGAYRPAVRNTKYRIYGIVGCEGRWWLRNELLDGNAHYIGNHDTFTVDKEELTGCLKAGVGLRYHKVDIRFTWLWWTREYKTQESTPNYGSVTLGLEF